LWLDSLHLSYSENKQNVEGAEAEKDEENFQHQLSVAWCIFVDLSQLLLCGFNIIESLFCVLVNSLN